MSESVESLVATVRDNNRVCPLPRQWKRLWEMLPNHDCFARHPTVESQAWPYSASPRRSHGAASAGDYFAAVLTVARFATRCIFGLGTGTQNWYTATTHGSLKTAELWGFGVPRRVSPRLHHAVSCKPMILVRDTNSSVFSEG